MRYKHITVAARIAPLSVVLTSDYEAGVAAEARLANAAPELAATLRYLVAAIPSLCDESHHDRRKQNAEALTAFIQNALKQSEVQP